MQQENTDVDHASTRAWMVVGLLWIVAMLNYLDRIMLTSMRDSIREAIPMTDAQFGSLMSVFLWVYAVLSPLGGYLGDRWGRSRVIVASLFVWSGVTWWMTLAQTFTELMTARALMGISEACYLPAALALISDYHRGPTRSLATGIHNSGIYIGCAVGGVGGWLADHYGWQSGFALFGSFGVLYAVVLAFLLRDAPSEAVSATQDGESHDRPSLMASVADLLRQPSFLMLVLVFSAFSLVNWGVLTWLPTYLRECYDLSQGQAGLSGSISNQAGSFIGIMIGGFWADRWSRTNNRSRMLVPLVGVCLGGPCLFAAAATDLLPGALLGVAMYGFGKSFADANWMPMLCQISDSRSRATGYGIMNLCSCLVGGAAAWAAGSLKDADVGLSTTLQVLGVVYFASGWLFLFIYPRRNVKA